MLVRVLPAQVWSFDDLPPHTLALDGACAELRLDPASRRFSFDHHAGVVRLGTRATCEQVFDALLLGLDPSDLTVLVNDVDGDVVLSVWLLERFARWRDPAMRECVRPLVANVGLADAHGPAYPLPEPRLVDGFIARVMAPLEAVQRTGWSADQAKTVLRACLQRLEAWWQEGLAPTPQPRPRGLIEPALVDHGTWVFADFGDLEPGTPALGCDALYARGYDRVVLCTRVQGGRVRCTLAKRSDLVDGFPLFALYAALNEAEAHARGGALAPGETWGGSSSVGGAPRAGSELSPEVIVAVVGAVVGRRAGGPS